MKLLRFQANDVSRTGIVTEQGIVDLERAGCRFHRMWQILRGGRAALDAVAETAARTPAHVAVDSVRLLAPVERPGKYLAIGMNYAAHADEVEKVGIAKHQHQVWFNKQTSCICGPFDDIDPGVHFVSSATHRT